MSPCANAGCAATGISEAPAITGCCASRPSRTSWSASPPGARPGCWSSTSLGRGGGGCRGRCRRGDRKGVRTARTKDSMGNGSHRKEAQHNNLPYATLPALPIHFPIGDKRCEHTYNTRHLEVMWLRRGSLLVRWADDDEPCYLPWVLPWLVDPAPRRAPRWQRAGGAVEYDTRQMVVEDRGAGVIRLTDPS